MTIAICIALYGIAFYWGCKLLTGKDRKLHRLWYGCILAWCAYINICGITHNPHLSVSSLYLIFFQPAGRMVIQWLGG